MKKVLLFSMFIFFIFVSSVFANPVPLNVPYFRLHVEDMKAVIEENDNVDFEGIYGFSYGIELEERFCVVNEDCEKKEECFDNVCIPEGGCKSREDCVGDEFCLKGRCIDVGTDMYFPMPPDARDIEVYYNDKAIEWEWGENKYIADAENVMVNLPKEYKEWPTIVWHLSMADQEPEGGNFEIKVKYRHSLISYEGKNVFLYSLGTGNELNWRPPLLLSHSGKPFVSVSMEIEFSGERYNFDSVLDYFPKDLEWKGIVFESSDFPWNENYLPTKDFVLFLKNEPKFMRGDVNGDNSINIADPVYLLNYLFRSGEKPKCLGMADVNGDNSINIADPVYLLNYLFRGGEAPSSKKPNCEPIEPVFACEQNSDCMKSDYGCCNCANGGSEVAINKGFIWSWRINHPERCPGFICLAIYMCTNREPRCVLGRCELV